MHRLPPCANMDSDIRQRLRSEAGGAKLAAIAKSGQADNSPSPGGTINVRRSSPAWAPLMAIIYSLPYPLQFPLFSLALTFWVLLLTYMTNRFAGKIEADAALALSVATEDRPQITEP